MECGQHVEMRYFNTYSEKFISFDCNKIKHLIIWIQAMYMHSFFDI